MDRFDVAKQMIQRAGEVLRRCHLEHTEISQKTGHQDLVTFWDRKIERQLRQSILTAFPEDSIVGEEYPSEKTAAGGSPGIWIRLMGPPILSISTETMPSLWDAGRAPRRVSAWYWMWRGRSSTGPDMVQAPGLIRVPSMFHSAARWKSCFLPHRASGIHFWSSIPIKDG